MIRRALIGMLVLLAFAPAARAWPGLGVPAVPRAAQALAEADSLTFARVGACRAGVCAATIVSGYVELVDGGTVARAVLFTFRGRVRVWSAGRRVCARWVRAPRRFGRVTVRRRGGCWSRALLLGRMLLFRAPAQGFRGKVGRMIRHVDVLDSLLEGFDPSEPRGWHGRWIRGRGGKPGRLEGSYNGVKLERGQEPIFRHVDDPTRERTFRGGSGFGRLSDVKP